MKPIRKLTPVLAAMAIAAPGVGAAQSQVMQAQDREWITITGPMTQVMNDRFVIDYGDGRSPVEWDGMDSSGTGMFRNGDWVTVSGRIDNSMWERRTIEGETLYHSRHDRRFWSDAADEEGDYRALLRMAAMPTEGEWVRVTGEVTQVDRVDNEIMVDTGPVSIQVDTERLGNADFATLGDRVSVTGRLDDADLWDAREVDATSMLILEQG